MAYQFQNIRMLVIEDNMSMLSLVKSLLMALGVGTLAEAREAATNGEFQAAILDVNLDGEEIYPVADILAARGLPFVFVTGYGERSLPDPHSSRPALQKPFQAEQLETALSALLAAA